MLLSDLIRYSIKAFTEKRLRSALTIAGIAIGPLALVMMTSVVMGYSVYVEKQITGLGQNIIVVFPSSDYVLKQADLDYLKSLEGVEDARPFYSIQGVIRTSSGEQVITLYAIDYDMLFKAISGLRVSEGEVPSPSEVTDVIVGHAIAYDPATRAKRYEVGDVIQVLIIEVIEAGKTKIRRIYLRVAAILEEYGGAPFFSPDHTIFMSFQAGRRILKLSEWSGILVLAKDPGYVDKVANTIRESYRDAVSVISFLEIARIVSSVTAAMNFITFSTSLSAFAVAAAGIAATMITSVIERTREIGVLKALGFTDTQVMSMILCEGVLMSLIGAAIGISLGVIGAYILASHGFTIRTRVPMYITAPPLITPELIARTLAITVVIGIIGSVFPAYRAAKIPPAVALRYE